MVVLSAIACGSSEPAETAEPAVSATSAPPAVETPEPAATSEPAAVETPEPAATSAPPAVETPEPAETTQAPATPTVPYEPVTADEPAHLELGREVYAAMCAGCHGADGVGSVRGPPLIDIADRQPDRGVHITIVTYGVGTMLGREGAMTPEEIDAVVSYMRLAFLP